MLPREQCQELLGAFCAQAGLPMVTVVLQDTLTKAERTLIEKDPSPAIATCRTRRAGSGFRRLTWPTSERYMGAPHQASAQTVIRASRPRAAATFGSTVDTQSPDR